MVALPDEAVEVEVTVSHRVALQLSPLSESKVARFDGSRLILPAETGAVHVQDGPQSSKICSETVSVPVPPGVHDS